MFTIKGWTIGKKIYFLSGTLLLAISIVGFMEHKGTASLIKQLTEVSDVQLPASRNMTLVDMMHDGLRASALNAIIVARTKDKNAMVAAQEEFDEYSKNIRDYLNSIEKLDVNTNIRIAINKTKPKIEDYIIKTKEVVTFALAGDETKALEKLPEFQKAFGVLEKELDSLGNLVEKDAQRSNQRGKELGSEIGGIGLAVSLTSLVLGLLLTLYVARSLIGQLKILTQNLQNEAGAVNSASVKIATISEELSQATIEQAASLQETSSSLEEINSMISSNTENAKQSALVSGQSLKMAEQGKQVVDHVIKAISDINISNNEIMEQINDTNKEIESIVNIINEIGAKTKVINDIVFQTKLLSFNASVEAARAGEQGKGFAVVAEEVGNLAAMSGAAALEITNMLEGSIKKVEGIVGNSKDKIGKLVLVGREKVNAGTSVAHECEVVLVEIVKSVSDVSKMILEISSASEEQAHGVREITKAVTQLDQVTQQNTTNSTDSASAADTLSIQASKLNSLVLELVESIEGRKEHVSAVELKPHSPSMNKSIDVTKIEKKLDISLKDKKSSQIPLTGTTLPLNTDKRFEDV